MDWDELIGCGSPIGMFNCKPKVAVQNQAVCTWNDIYFECTGSSYDGLSVAHQWMACNTLKKQCEMDGIDYEDYLRWFFTVFTGVFSPNYLLRKDVRKAYRYHLSQNHTDTQGYLVLETGQIVGHVFQNDGQLMTQEIESGPAYDADGNLIHVTRIR